MYHELIANLQVLNARRAEIAALLPESTVVRWSDDYVTVLDDGLNMESISAAGKNLSSRLLWGTVVSVAMEDDERLELAVWQKGKQLTAQIISPVSRVSRKGDPQVFCRALGLPEEDVARLETVWTRGNVKEQLSLTGVLMGAPLDCSAQCLPFVKVQRDAAWVDDWMRYLVDYAKGKNQTKIQILQEFSGLMLDEQTDGNGWEGFFYLRPVGGGADYDWTESFFCHPGPGGKLEQLPQLDPRPEVVRSPHAAYKYVPIGEGRVLSFLQEGEPACSVVAEDSAGLLACPLVLALDGKRRSCLDAWAMEDGGVLVLLGESEEDGIQGGLVRYAPDGMALWSRELEQPCEPRLFSDGQLWLSDETGFFSIDIQGKDGTRIGLVSGHHIDRERECVVKYTMLGQSLPGEVWLAEDSSSKDRVHKSCKILSFDSQGNPFYDASLPVGVEGLFCDVLVMKKQVLLYQYNQGIWLLSALDLNVLAGSADHRKYLDAALDGAGRIWLFVGDETEAYDENLSLISRHHMRGEVLHHYLDQKGRLCAVTYDGEAHILRVYRLA